MKNKIKNKKTYDQLISGYYGTSKLFRNKSNPDFVVSKSFDNGETLVQKPKNNFLEYVVQSSIATNTPFEEYVVPKISASNISRQNSVDINTFYSPTQTYTAAQETQTDLTNPLQDDAAKLALLDRLNDTYTAPADKPVTPAVINNPSAGNNQNNATNNSYKNPSTQSSFTEAESFNDISKAASTDDDFVKDMQAILTGQKVFDPINKKTIDKSQSFGTSQSQSQTPSLPQMENKHAIFDQIAQSMEYAKAYDLGSIDLDKRFNDFDKIIAIEKSIPAEKKSSVRSAAMSSPKANENVVGNEEFIKDLDAISKAANANKAQLQSSAMSVPDYSYTQNPAAVVAAIETADAIQIGLGAAAIVQAQVSASQGSFSLSYDKAQRMLTSEARTQMPGAQSSKQSFSRRLFFIGGIRTGTAEASVIIEWEGNAYGEIGTAIIRRDLQNSTEWSKSSANLTITKIDRIPKVKTDPRTWPLVYTFEGTYDPLGNGYYEFSGEFEINAFGGLKFNRHEVVSRSVADFAIMGQPADFVKKGQDIIVQTPEIPQEQINYLRTKLP